MLVIDAADTNAGGEFGAAFPVDFDFAVPGIAAGDDFLKGFRRQAGAEIDNAEDGMAEQFESAEAGHVRGGRID